MQATNSALPNLYESALADSILLLLNNILMNFLFKHYHNHKESYTVL